MTQSKCYGDYFRYSYKATTGPASTEFLEWLRANGVPEAVVRLFAGTVLTEEYEEAPLFLSEQGIMGDNESVPCALRDGLLLVGRCYNGDWVAIDCRHAVGAVGFVCHETMHGAADVNSEFVVVGRSFEAFMGVLRKEEGLTPRDYFEALEFWRTEGPA